MRDLLFEFASCGRVFTSVVAQDETLDSADVGESSLTRYRA